ncbi:MAG: hypothetical protein KDE45_06095 [Caldilineaceae bacterium]|nr:hypothetical protein [Caldilineaceae bacterium]
MKTIMRSLKRGALTVHMDTIQKGARTVWHGDFIAYHPNGQPAVTGSYVHGKPNGTWRRWYENGKLASVHRYVLGEMDGNYTQFFENGDKAREGSFKRGGPEGDQRIYFKGGKNRRLIHYKSGRLLRVEQLIGGRWTITDLENMIWQIDGDDFHYEKVCVLFDNGELVCKTPAQILEDLSTMLPPEVVSQILEELDRLYDEHGLDQSKETLVGCAGIVFATNKDTSGAPTVQLTDNPKLNRAPMTQQEIDHITSACRQASLGSMGINPRLPGFKKQRDNFVRDTVAAIDEGIGNCRNSGNDMISAPILVPLIVGLGIGIGVQKGLQWMDDGYEVNPVDKLAEPLEYRSKSDPVNNRKYVSRSGYEFIVTKQKNDNGTTTVTSRGSNGTEIVDLLDSDGRQISHRETNSDGVVREYYEAEDGSEVEEITDNDGNVTFKVNGLDKNDTGEQWNASNVPPRRAPSRPSQPTPGMADPDNQGGGCEQLQMWWEQKKAYCEQSNWQTYDCEQILRTFHGCVDTAEIYPTPDGGVACAQPTGMTPAQQREEACRRRGMIELPSGFGADSCQPLENVTLPQQDICLDPAAMCRPDAIFAASDLEMRGAPGIGQARMLSPQSTSGPQRIELAANAVAPVEHLRVLDDDSFAKAVKHSEVPHVVIFGAKTCPPCQRVKRNLSGIEHDLGRKVEVCYLEVPQNPKTASLFDIQFTPTIIVFQGGRVLGQRRVGAATREMLVRYVDRSLSVGEVQDKVSLITQDSKPSAHRDEF